MSSELDRIIRSKRRYDAKVKMLRQAKIAKTYGLFHSNSIHVYHKHNALNCGNSNCVMCGNPRRVFGEPTLQEKKCGFDLLDLIDE